MQQQQQQPQQSPAGVATPSSVGSQTTLNSGAAAATASVSTNTSTPIRIGSAKHAGGGDSLAPPLGNVTSSSHSVPGTPQQQPQSSSVPTASGSHLQLQNSGALSMAASNQSLGVSVGAGSSISGINITPPNSAGLRQSSGEFAQSVAMTPLLCIAAAAGAGDQDTSSSLASIAFQCRVVSYRIVSCFVLCCLYTLSLSLSISLFLTVDCLSAAHTFLTLVSSFAVACYCFLFQFHFDQLRAAIHTNTHTQA